MSEYTDKYHSALEPSTDVPHEAIDYYEAPDGSVMFQHDILGGVAEPFSRANVVYTEPAWRQGYERFMQRADAKNIPGFDAYMGMQERVIRELDIPAYMIGGANTLHYIDPDDAHEIYFEFHDCDAWAFLWNNPEYDPYDVDTVVDVLYTMRENYNWALDFNCGQGRTARAMHDAGKQFVCSDVNGRVINQIAQDLYDRDS